MGDSMLSTFIHELLDILIMNNGIDIGIAKIYAWNQEMPKEVLEQNLDDDDSEKGSFEWHYSFLIVFSIAVLLIILYCGYR